MLTLHYTSNSGMNAQGHGWLHPDAAQQGGFALSSQCWPEQHKLARAGRYGPAPPPPSKAQAKTNENRMFVSKVKPNLFIFCISFLLLL